MVLFADLNEQDFGEIHTPIDDMVFAADAPLYNEGQTAVGVFTLRKGMVKLVRATADGRERIVRVLRPGDVIGLEALATARYDRRIQPVDATHSLNISAGVWKPSVLRGLSFNCRAIALS
jgi:CRP-like cAMP-binding protein